MLQQRGGEGEAGEVIVDTTVHVSYTGLSRGRKGSHLINLETIKIAPFYIGRSASCNKGKEFLLILKGSYTKQNKNISVLGAKTKALEAELKFLLQSHVLPSSVDTQGPMRDIILTALAGSKEPWRVS